jgi:hypothetical protein
MQPCAVRVRATITRLFAFSSTQDDLAIMIEGTDGLYYLQAGAILIPGPSLRFSSFPSLRFSSFTFLVSDMRM